MNYQPMNRFSVQSSAEANYLDVAPINTDIADSIAFQMLQEDLPEFFMPLQLRNINGQQSFRYKLPNAISLRNSIMQSMTKRLYVNTALGLISPFIRCKDWLLDYHYICIDPNYVLKSKKNDSYIFAYIPEASFRNDDESIMSFFEGLLNRIDITDDRDYQIRVMQYFRDNAGSIALYDLYKMFSEERIVGGSSSPVSSFGGIQPAPEERNMSGFGQQHNPVSQSGFQQAPAQNFNTFSQNQPQQGFRSTPVNPQPQMTEMKQQVQQNNAAPSGGASFGAANVLFGNGKVDQPIPETQPEPEKKKGGLFGGLFGGKNRNNDANGDDPFGFNSMNNSVPQTSSPVSSATNSVDDLLFGGDDGSSKQQKGSSKKGGFGGLFGSGKNKETAEEPVQQPVQQQNFQQQNVRQAPVQQQFVQNPSVPYHAPVVAEEFTEIVGFSGAQSYLELIDSSFEGVPRRIDIDTSRPVLMIGRRTADNIPDIAFPESCKGVSRQHARIEQNGAGMVIIDLGSAYHTVLDGQRLIPNQPYQLRNNSTLVFVEERPIRYRVHC